MLPLLKGHKFDQSLGASTLPVCFKHQIRFYKVNSTKHNIIINEEDDGSLEEEEDVQDQENVIVLPSTSSGRKIRAPRRLDL